MSQSDSQIPSNSFLDEVLDSKSREMVMMHREIVVRAEMAELRSGIMTEWRGELSVVEMQKTKFRPRDIRG